MMLPYVRQAGFGRTDAGTLEKGLDCFHRVDGRIKVHLRRASPNCVADEPADKRAHMPFAIATPITTVGALPRRLDI